MESGAISEAQISASSQYDNEHGPKNARLRNTHGKGSWVAGLNDVDQWLQVDLLGLDIVTGIATQGRHSEHAMWVTKYKLQYSNDGESFRYYKEQGENVDKVETNLKWRPWVFKQFLITRRSSWFFLDHLLQIN